MKDDNSTALGTGGGGALVLHVFLKCKGSASDEHGLTVVGTP